MRRRSGLLQRAILVVCASALASCKARGEDPKPEIAPRDTGLEPLTAVGRIVADGDGAIRAPAPPGADWECFQRRRADATTRETSVQCRTRAGQDFVLTRALDYAVPAGAMLSAEALARGPYKQANEGAFGAVRYVKQSPVDDHGHLGFESELEADHAKMGTLRKRERILTHGNHVLVLSAEGSADALAANRPFVEAWFARTELSTLAKAP